MQTWKGNESTILTPLFNDEKGKHDVLINGNTNLEWIRLLIRADSIHLKKTLRITGHVQLSIEIFRTNKSDTNILTPDVIYKAASTSTRIRDNQRWFYPDHAIGNST